MREQGGSRALTGHGTLYKALGRLEEFGLLTSDWEAAEAAEGRPRRRLYELTGQGVRVAEQARADAPTSTTTNAPAVGRTGASPSASPAGCSGACPRTPPGAVR
jgi:PadR family transcriptional regulator, regulatory protein PadR